MREPNFSESQLQQAINTAYVRYIFETRGEWVFANVPSLIAEFGLGWDSAFYFPWTMHPPEPDHEGCNFFIQYKLSGELTSAGAKEWSHWGTEYFRFKIPHSTKDTSGIFVDDYHQWHRLKELANQGYPTFYATNATLNKDDLRSASKAGTLLNDVPLLDVRAVNMVHKYVTFTPSSTVFMLHSEKEKFPKTNFSKAIASLLQDQAISLEESTELLLHKMKEIGGNDEEWSSDLLRIDNAFDAQEPRRFQVWGRYVLLASFVSKHFGAEMLWLPDNR